MHKQLLTGIALVALTLAATGAAQSSRADEWYDFDLEDVKVAAAATQMVGAVSGAIGIRSEDSATNRIHDSFDDFAGVLHVDQNTGANSLVQTNSTISALLDCDCEDQSLRWAETATSMVGAVGNNLAASALSASYNELAYSFNGFSGIAQIQQNAGDNALIQSNATVAALVN